MSRTYLLVAKMRAIIILTFGPSNKECARELDTEHTYPHHRITTGIHYCELELNCVRYMDNLNMYVLLYCCRQLQQAGKQKLRNFQDFVRCCKGNSYEYAVGTVDRKSRFLIKKAGF